MSEFINLTAENLNREHLCCIIRKKKAHPGVEAKREWLRERIAEGHIFRKLDADGCAFIEYAPLEKAWVPVQGDKYMYIYCLWVLGDLKGRGYGRQLMDYCVSDAEAKGMSGVCMLGAEKQKAWLSDQRFAFGYGFEEVDSAGEYRLLALSFNGSQPYFMPEAKKMTVDTPELTVYYGDQCPFIPQRIEKLKEYCSENAVPARFIHIDTLEKAKSLPCVFNNWAVFHNGKFITVNQIDETMLKKIING